MLSLDTSVEQLHMIGNAHAEKLHKMGINSIYDLVFHIPFRYDDYGLITEINSLLEGERVSIIATIKNIKNIYSRGGTRIQQAVVADKTGEIDVIWYNQVFLLQVLPVGTKVALAGTVKSFRNKFILEVPEYEIVRENKKLVHTGRLVPIYPETEGISSKWLRSRIFPLINMVADLILDELPETIRKNYNLLPLPAAIKYVHFPNTFEDAWQAKRRICFDELLILQLASLIRKMEWEQNTKGFSLNLTKWNSHISKFIKELPFMMTNAQIRCTNEILSDLTKHKPMNRLLEGDVGSGKTVVAAIATLLAVYNGYQVAFMAPTEILAQQHYKSFKMLLHDQQIGISLITAQTKKFSTNTKIYIGTHALLTKSFKIKRLGLIIIDEQHRFGVEQRSQFKAKGKNPHILSLTATPIPRTIALTLFDHLNLSLLDEMPIGRQMIKTYAIGPDKRDAAYAWIRKKIIESNFKEQAYIVCPLIEESDTLSSVKAVKTEFIRLEKGIYKDLKMGLLHGKMKPKDKQKVLDEFKRRGIQILIATPVVEVGIDIPNATIMLIEGADRFGLAQLHQLRGRVGRSDIQSYCILLSDAQNDKTLTRLKLLEKYHQGHVLAEFDLSMRGQGNIFGTAQHGIFGLKYADMENINLIKDAQTAAHALINKNPTLNSYPLLQAKVQKYTIEKVINN